MAQGVKTGGRQAGTPNRRTVATRRWVQEQADPLAFLFRVMNGEVIDYQTPTMAERLIAARELRRVIVPDAKDTPVSIPLPQVSGPSDWIEAMNVVLSAVSSGFTSESEPMYCENTSASALPWPPMRSPPPVTITRLR